MTTAPTVVGTSLQNVNGTQLPAITTPAGSGNFLQGAIANQDSTATADYTNDAGLARNGAPFVTATTGTRVNGLYGAVIAGSLPANVTFTRAGAGTRQVGGLLLLDGVHEGTPVDVASAAVSTAGAGGASTIPGLVVSGDNRLGVAIFGANWASPQDSTISIDPTGWTLRGYRQEPITGLSSVSRTSLAIYTRELDNGATGDITLTYVGTPAQRGAQMVVLNPADDPLIIGDFVLREWVEPTGWTPGNLLVREWTQP